MGRTQQRGRAAERPSEIPSAGWRDIGWRVYEELSRDHVSVVSAGVAFFGLLALFPAIGALMSIAGLFMDPAALFGVLLSIYGASKGMRTLMEGMNIAYDEEEERGFVREYTVSFLLTLFLVLGLFIALGLALVVPALVDAFGLPDTLATIVAWGRWLLLAALTVMGLAVLYRFGPSREDPEWRWVSWGSVIATVFWIAGSLAFSLYVQNFGDYNEAYGTIGGVIILLTWLWLSAYIVLLGAEINSEMEHQTRADTTTGRHVPMGERGAVKADNLGPSP